MQWKQRHCGQLSFLRHNPMRSVSPPIIAGAPSVVKPTIFDIGIFSDEVMAMATNFVTLGELWSSHVEMEEEDEAIFSRIKVLIENHLPDGWRDWKVIDWKKEDLFGKKIDHKVLNKIRFALPTLELVKAFYPEATSVGEKTYRNIKLRLLDWNLCRALIMSPRQVACQLRGSMAQAELFNKAVEPLKHTMRSRELTSEALSTDGESNYTSRSKRRRCQSSSSDDEYPVRTEKPMKRRRRVLSSSSEEDVNETRLRRVESMVENLYHLVSGNKENDGSVMNSTWQAPTPTGEELYDADSIGTCGSVNDLDTFSPVTREIEHTVPRADPVIETQGMKCQRFGEETWNKIRYVDAQKKLHASPVFSTLKVNSSLYNNGHASPMTDMLSKSDLAFGTISHGLLKQRRIIHEALKEAGNKHPEAADTLKKVFAANSEYKTISDDLLQFVCGKRAEIIESRRKLYEPKSSYYRSIVNEIPPSGTHLWDEEQLKDVVKMHGVTKIAPVRWQSNLGKVALRQKVPQGTSHEKYLRQGSFKKMKKAEFKHSRKPGAKSHTKLARRTTRQICLCLEKYGSLTIDSQYPERLRDPFLNKATNNSTIPTDTKQIRDTSIHTNGSRNTKPHKSKGGSKTANKNRFLIKDVFDAEIGGLVETSVQSKKIEQLHHAQEVPPYEPSQTAIISPGKRLYGKSRPFSSIFPFANKAKALALSGTLLPAKHLRYDSTTIWPKLRSTGVCKSYELGGELLEETKHSSNGLFGRFFDRKPESRRTKARGIHPDRYSHKAGFLHQPGEVRNKTYTEIGISRYYVEHHKKSKEFTGGQNPPSANINPSWNQEQDLELEAGKGTARENGICLVCYPIGSTTLQKDTKSSQSDVRKPTKETVQYRPGRIARAKMVGEKLKRVIHNLHERTGSSYNNRCLKHGLGSPSRRHFEERKLDRAAGKVAYQQKRNVRGLLSAKKPPRSIGKQNTVNSDGQQDGGFLLEKSRRNQVGHAFGIDQEDPGAGTSIQYVSENRTYSRKLQYCDRPPIQRKGSARLALIKDSSEEDLRKVGNPLHRPICDSRISRRYKICNAIPMQGGRIRQRIYKNVGVQASVDIPSSTPNTKSSPTPQLLSGSFHNDSPQVGKGVLAAPAEETCHRPPVHHSESEGSPGRSSNQPASSKGNGFTPGGMEDTGWSDIANHWSKDERRILETSWRKSTLKTYAVAWKSWQSWAKKRRVSVKNPNPTQVAQYLCFLHNTRKLALRTILLHKSTIATFSNPLHSEGVSSSPTVKQVIRGIANANPPATRPKIWNIDKLLSWINDNHPDTNSIFQVARHLSLLLLLSSGRRVHDLTLLRIDSGFFEQTEEYIIFWPQHGSKTDKHNYVQSGWKLLKNRECIWDLVHWTTIYLEISEKRRNLYCRPIPQLFVTTRGKIGPASRSVIAGWVRTALKSAGIEGGAGSTRSAVATSRFNDNMPLDEVLQKGNWQGSSNFFKHYYKNIDKDLVPDNSNRRLISDKFVPI
ncbi:unnamed protein product [Acanthoscelides obtectus]|uniref:Tyr recombinase domain-containing protein n=1 Tax=Acanthoscelides obtectus TaxID=200917 RepID=A0A9P0L4W8_ACAOB|nr:unnamed protein product [Acanthoscelides obtectus]CAK1670549.1 hypothetical protein AOBTE_LOCUS27665 [Acanthoscelides obtectus]